MSDVRDAVAAALCDLRWPDGEPKLRMARKWVEEIADAAIAAYEAHAGVQVQVRCHLRECPQPEPRIVTVPAGLTEPEQMQVAHQRHCLAAHACASCGCDLTSHKFTARGQRTWCGRMGCNCKQFTAREVTG